MTDPDQGRSHQLLRSRLEAAAAELARRATELDARRLESFGTGRMELLATERVRTAHNVVPRDVEAVGSQLILAYNAPDAGSGPGIRPEEVFAVHHLTERDGGLVLHPNGEGLVGSVLDDDQFRRDLTELHTYVRDSRIEHFYRRGQQLLAVFRTGSGERDLRVLRWTVEVDGSLRYLDDRGVDDHRFPPAHDVDWVPATRDDHRDGRHVVIGGRLVIDPLGGSLDIRLTDATGAPGELLCSEPVDDADQSLADCAIASAAVGADLVLLRILPYREQAERWYVANLLVRRVDRLDGIAPALRVLPDGQGLIFPGGLYLRTGEVRRFDLDPVGMELLDVVRSPNGEDVLYLFHQRRDGRSILLPYNVVRQEVVTPIWCHGHCLFDDGRMVVFREEAGPTRVHPLQIWATPFCSDDHYADLHRERGPLHRIGNPDLVAGIADALALTRLVADVEPSVEVYGDLLGSAGRVLDRHHWLADEVVGDLAAPIHDIRMAADGVIDEFERLLEIRAAASAALAGADADLEAALTELRLSPPSTTEQHVAFLARLRNQIGHLHSLAEQREIDGERLDGLVERARKAHDDLVETAANHLAGDGAFDHYHAALAGLADRLGAVATSIEAAEVVAGIDAVAEGMDVVAATIGDLVVADPTVRTVVLEQVSAVLAELNRVRAEAERVRAGLVETETGAAFTTELGLIGQAVATSLARADTPEACDDALNRLLSQLERIESAGPRTDRQLDELADRRQQLVDAFDGRRQLLLDRRQHAADRLVAAAERILVRAAERASDLAGVDDVNGFFAADPLIGRLRGQADQLRQLGDQVRADELLARLAGARERALLAVRDRNDLIDGDALVLGRHRFSIDRRRRELTLLADGDRLSAVLAGTDLRLPVDDPELDACRDLWDLPFPSETPELYRAAYLAADLVIAALDGDDPTTTLRTLTDPDRALAGIRAALDGRHDEGYDRGVHDHDGARLLAALAERALTADTLLTPAPVRARAQLAWCQLATEVRTRWTARGRAVAELGTDRAVTATLASGLAAESGLDAAAATYLLAELCRGGEPTFARPADAARAAAVLAGRPGVLAALDALDGDPSAAFDLIAEHVTRAGTDPGLVADVAVELVLAELPRRDVAARLDLTVDGLAGDHPTVTAGAFAGRLDELLHLAGDHRRRVAPRHRAMNERRRQVVTRVRDELQLGDLEPRVPDGFVRNRLINRLYLPLIGDNLARQIGTVDQPTAARSGLLLLLSPPGYGKTTLVDYVAASLGMALVRISGPSLGHEVTSLDPARAPSATSAREVARLNLAFALGANVLLHVDDIQHLSPELLQRFISLCDGQRRIEGVIEGRPTTFDLRGKRFAVVMAGNPYTESGQRFQVPDMLANRADTHNLGDVAEANEDLFAASYLENALAANPVTAPLVGADDDLTQLLAATRGAEIDPTRLSRTYSAAELGEVVAMLGHFVRVERVVLAVNRRYIASAATEDRYRTEPPFLLQGSYRNMTRMASKLVPAMTEAEVDALIDDHYRAESQALTGAAEANLLQLDRIRGRLEGERAARWDEIVSSFRRRQRLGGDELDPTTRVVAAIGEVALALGDRT